MAAAHAWPDARARSWSRNLRPRSYQATWTGGFRMLVAMQDDPTRILGIVGGTGPESTADYYRWLIAGWRQQRSDGTLPRLIINSVEGGGLWRLLEAADYHAVVAEVRPAVARLSAAGAGMVILASNPCIPCSKESSAPR